MITMHTFETANYDNYARAKHTCDAFKMRMHSELRPTCFKKYKYTVCADTIEQDEILTLLILASTAHAEQGKYKVKLAERIARKERTDE